MDLSERWALFGEYQFTWSDDTADLDGGGSLETRIITNALNLGVSYRF
jgi:lipid A oxidase